MTSNSTGAIRNSLLATSLVKLICGSASSRRALRSARRSRGRVVRQATILRLVRIGKIRQDIIDINIEPKVICKGVNHSFRDNGAFHDLSLSSCASFVRQFSPLGVLFGSLLDFLIIEPIEIVTGYLHPYPRLLLWDLVDPYLTHSHCAVLVVQPEVNIVVLIPTALATEVSARKIAAILLKLAYWLVYFHELECEFRTGLIVRKLVDAVVLVALVGDVLMDRRHHLPGAFLLGLPGMFGSRDPPPSHRHAGHHCPGVALLLRALLDTHIHEFQPLTFGLQPEVEGVLLLGHILGMEEHVGEKAVALNTAHEADVFERELQVLSSATVPEDKHTTMSLHLLLDDRPDRGTHLFLGDLVHAALVYGSNHRGQHTPYQDIEAQGLYPHGVLLHIIGSL